MSDTRIPQLDDVDVSVEAQKAADWWADRLGTTTSDTGDILNDTVLSHARFAGPDVTDEQRATFRHALAEAIEQHIVGDEIWAEAVERGNPQWGAQFRMIRVDYGPDEVLRGALKAAGVHDGVLSPLPNKTNMKVSPGLVLVAAGYGRPWETVYDASVEDVCGHELPAGDDEQPGDPAHYWHGEPGCVAANPEHCRRTHPTLIEGAGAVLPGARMYDARPEDQS